jgi:putative acetyltransferase
VNLRTARAEDTPHIHALIQTCYAEHNVAFDLRDPAEAHVLKPHTYFAERSGAFWVAGPDEASTPTAHAQAHAPIIGTVACLMHPDEPASTPPPGATDADIAELKSMYVHPRFRRLGLARRLAALVIDHARSAGAARLDLWSDTRFTAAHTFYESLGFTYTRTRHVPGPHPFDERGYTLPITPTQDQSTRTA